MDIYHRKRTTEREECILTIRDNTRAILRWLKRSNIRQEDELDASWLVN